MTTWNSMLQTGLSSSPMPSTDQFVFYRSEATGYPLSTCTRHPGYIFCSATHGHASLLINRSLQEEGEPREATPIACQPTPGSEGGKSGIGMTLSHRWDYVHQMIHRVSRASSRSKYRGFLLTPRMARQRLRGPPRGPNICIP